MIFQVLLLIFLLGGAVLGGIAAYRRPLLERGILLLTIPLAWILALLLLQAGILDFGGNMLVELVAGLMEAGDMLSGPTLSAGAAAMINSLVRLIAMVPLFLLILLLLRIAYAIAMTATKARTKCKLFKPGKKEDILKNLGISLVGALGGFVICMLLLLPVHFFSGLLQPTVDTFAEEKYNDTYVAAQADVIGSNLLPLAPETPCGFIQTYTGLRAAMDATGRQLCQFSITNQAGQKLDFNAQTLLAILVKDGALGVTLYEYSCNPQHHRVGDFSLAADVVEDIAKQEALLAMVQELLVQMGKEPTPAAEEETGESDALKDMVVSLAASYQNADAKVLQSDILALAELLRVVTTDLGDVPMQDMELEVLLFDYLADEEATYRVVNALSKIHVYGQVLSTVTEYGMNMLGDVLNIGADRGAYHDQYLLALQQLLNDRSVGSYELTNVETFIRHLAEAGIGVDDASLEQDVPADIRGAYDRYMDRMQALQDVLDGYTAKSDAQTYFVGSSGKVYLFDATARTWTEAGNDATLDRGSYFAQQLLEMAKRLLEADENAVLDEAALLNCVRAVATDMGSSHATYAPSCRALAESILDENTEIFAKNAIFRQDLLESLKTDIAFDEDANRQFAAIVHTAAEMFTQLTTMEDASLDAIMGQFPAVGRLLDGFTRFEMTSDVSELLLQALMQNSQFGAYFSADSMQTLIQDVKAGNTTYEQLFRSVQSLYNILNQISPLSPAA